MTKTLFQPKLDLILKSIQKELPTSYFEKYFSDLAITRIDPFSISFKSSHQSIIQENFPDVFEHAVINSYRKAKNFDTDSNPIFDGSFGESYEDCYKHYRISNNLQIKWENFIYEDAKYFNKSSKRENNMDTAISNVIAAQDPLNTRPPELKDITNQFLAVLENYVPGGLLSDLKNIRVWGNHKTVEIECLTPSTKPIIKNIMRSITSATFDLFEENLEIKVK